MKGFAFPPPTLTRMAPEVLTPTADIYGCLKNNERNLAHSEGLLERARERGAKQKVIKEYKNQVNAYRHIVDNLKRVYGI